MPLALSALTARVRGACVLFLVGWWKRRGRIDVAILDDVRSVMLYRLPCLAVWRRSKQFRVMVNQHLFDLGACILDFNVHLRSPR